MHPQLHPLFIDYCAHFVRGDFFECHEVAEDYWKAIAPGDKNHALVGYIQLAVSFYHERRGNIRGANKLRANAQRIFSQADAQFFTYIKRNTLVTLALGDELPLAPPLDIKVQQRLKQLPLLDDDFITHKHLLRDRSAIIAARAIKKASPTK